MMTITDASLGEKTSTTISNQIKDLITLHKGKVLDSAPWGKRTFAYEINHKTEGYYEVINFTLSPKETDSLKKKLNLIEGLVRYLITSTD